MLRKLVNYGHTTAESRARFDSVTKICLVCDKPFHPLSARHDKQKFCGNDCRTKAQQNGLTGKRKRFNERMKMTAEHLKDAERALKNMIEFVECMAKAPKGITTNYVSWNFNSRKRRLIKYLEQIDIKMEDKKFGVGLNDE